MLGVAGGSVRLAIGHISPLAELPLDPSGRCDRQAADANDDNNQDAGQQPHVRIIFSEMTSDPASTAIAQRDPDVAGVNEFLVEAYTKRRRGAS